MLDNIKHYKGWNMNSTVKMILGVLGIAVIAIFGMNQYEQYKLTKRANTAIESLQEGVANEQRKLSKQELIVRGRSDIMMIRSAIITERQSRMFKGDTSYANSLSSNDYDLFDKVTTNVIHPSEPTGWTKVGNHQYKYTYGTASSQNAVFEYSNQTGEFSCISPYHQCSEFD